MKTVEIWTVHPGIENAGGTQERTEFFISKGVSPEIASLNLDLVKAKLQDPVEGEGWTFQQCESAELEYRRYLHLCRKYGKGMVPNKIMDKFWHHHILDTVAYHEDCKKVFSHYLHHFPYFGMRGEKDAEKLRASFIRTKELYYETFGEPMARNEHTDCWHDCEDRCWHACSDAKPLEEAEELIYPDPITPTRVSYLTSKGIMPEIASLDFEMIKKKLQEKDEGAGWSPEQCEIAEVEYKRYLHLCKKYRSETLVPNLIMHTFWRYHILDTRAYYQDTEKVYGYYLHHNPYFGLLPSTELILCESFSRTQWLYDREFGEPMSREEVIGYFSERAANNCAKACNHHQG